MTNAKLPGQQPLKPQLHEPFTLDQPKTLRQRLRRLFIGKPIETAAQMAHRLPIALALPVLASDALSSNAYATEEILLVLATAHNYMGGPPTLHLVIPITLAIAVMMFIVAFSYRRAVMMYPTSGGSYTVARKNLGALPGVVAGSALIIDYILTVAVSVAAGVAAVTSYAPALFPYRVGLSLILIAFVAWVNLRGTRESGWTFAFPAYYFVTMMALLVGSFCFRFFTGNYTTLPIPSEPIVATHGLGLLVLLKAFSNGCAALTGVEAISNGVQIFQPPEARNAAKTLLILITTSVAIFLGLGFAAYVYQAIPSHAETLVSLLARHTFMSDGLFNATLGNFLYFGVISSVLLVLLIASNTAFADFPRLLSFIARDGYAPRVLLSLGDRLVYNRSIVYLALVSGALILALQASVSSLIGLYAVGVFICFTLSQAGMFRRIRKDREAGWQGAALLNAVGMVVTGAVAFVIAYAKFLQGAWVVLILIPALVLLTLAIKRHYLWFERRMAVHPGDENPLAGPSDHLTVIVLLSSDIHRGTLEGLEAARAFVEGRESASLRALHIEIDPEKTKRLTAKWDKLVSPHIGRLIQLEIVPSLHRALIPPILQYLDRIDAERQDDRIVVLIPEFETGGFWTHLLHNQTAPRLRQALFQRPNVTVITNRFFMQDDPAL
jgi:amino acid transporter